MSQATSEAKTQANAQTDVILAPAAASRATTDRPIEPDAPVTSTTWPVMSCAIVTPRRAVASR